MKYSRFTKVAFLLKYIDFVSIHNNSVTMKLTIFAFIILFCLQATGLEKDTINIPSLTPVNAITFGGYNTINLVTGGKPNFAIAADLEMEKGILEERQSLTKAVKVIQKAFKNCTGADVKVFHPEDTRLKDFPVVMSMGDNAITRRLNVDTSQIPRQGFIVRATSTVVLIAGYDGSFVPDSYTPYDWARIRYNGTLNAAYDFVERVLGVRYYFPGIGTIYPKHNDVSIPTMEYKDEPHFINRFSHTIARAQDKSSFYPEMQASQNEDWEARYRLARGNGFWAGQAPAVELLDKKHPNELDTIHYRDGNGHLYYNAKKHIGNYMDTSNLDLVDLLLQELNEHFNSNGKDQSVWMNFQANLNYITFGQCYTVMHDMDSSSIREYNLVPDELRGNPLQELSNVHARFTFHFAKKLKEAYPGRRLIVTPYSNYFLPPTIPEYQKYPDNIDLCLSLHNLPEKAVDEAVVKKWRNLMQDYYEMLGRRPIAAVWMLNPNIFHNRWARAVSGKYLGRIAQALSPFLGKEEMIFDYNGSHEWELFYNYYLVWRCLWNPNFNVEAALKEMWALLYGNAAPLVEAFYNTVCQQYEKNVLGTPIDQAFGKDTLDKLEELLQKAGKAVEPDSLEAKRLQLFKRYWNKTFIEARALSVFKRPEYNIKPCASKPVIDGVVDDIWEQAQEITLKDAPFSPSPGKCPTSIRMMNCGDGIYILLKSQGMPRAKKEYAVWNNCSLEILVKKDLKDMGHHQLAFDAMGQIFSGYSAYENMLENVTVKHNSKCTCASNTKDGNWLMECFIPWNEIGGLPKGNSLYGNVVISRKQPEKCIQSFSLTFGKEDDDLYGIFIIEK